MMRTPSGDKEAKTVRGSTSEGILQKQKRGNVNMRASFECFMLFNGQTFLDRKSLSLCVHSEYCKTCGRHKRSRMGWPRETVHGGQAKFCDISFCGAAVQTLANAGSLYGNFVSTHKNNLHLNDF
ncbi:hypothetical protein CHARACLAT_022608 [Characodon lateralis]|uniref:Uncharacterized protein n=1 Tax=Characodon lateralis TaxID=208331 RepID=A0ABU7CQD2_9TELE|nr:hypothetical protein [Characodon lateralis]